MDELSGFDELAVDQIEMPTPQQARAIIEAADKREPKDKGRAGAQFRLMFHGGLRPSEMLGMPLRGVGVTKFGRVQLKVVQRLSTYGEIGRVKNKNSKRLVTLGENPSLWIRKYILAAGLPKNDFLFPAKSRRRAAATTEQPAAGGDLAKFESKRPELYSNFREKVWTSILADAGFATKVLSQRKYWRTGEKRPFDSWQPEFTPHQGRHFAASALIASGCAPKRLQAFLGRETLQVTMDVYGHLFPDQRADEDLADALDAQISNG